MLDPEKGYRRTDGDRRHAQHRNPDPARTGHFPVVQGRRELTEPGLGDGSTDQEKILKQIPSERFRLRRRIWGKKRTLLKAGA